MKFSRSSVATTKQKFHTIKTYGKATGSAFKTALTAVKFINESEKDKESNMNENQQRQHMQKRAEDLTKHHLGTFIMTMWNMTVVDIEATLKKSCHKIMADRDVFIKVRERRILGLDLIGKIYMENGATEEAGINDLKKQIELMMGNTDYN